MVRRPASTIGGVAILAVLAVPCTAGPQSKLFIDGDRAELVRAVPELAGLQFDTGQGRLDALLQAAGANLASEVAKFADISAAEDIHEMRFESVVGVSRRETFRYRIRPVSNAADQLDEFREDPTTKAVVKMPAHNDFLVFGHFADLMNNLLPQYRAQLRVRYLGRLKEPDAFVVAFAQAPDETLLRSHLDAGPNGDEPELQGLVWIDAAANRILRVRFDVLEPVEGFALESFTTDISVVPVTFQSTGSVLWLPVKATVHAKYAGGELHTVHRFSDYRLEGTHAAGRFAPDASGDDAWELLDRGMALTLKGQPDAAIPVLREAVKLNPEIALFHLHLANALRAVRDFAGAEGEARAALKGAPDSGPEHNLLGIVLFARGELPGAAAELRASVNLQPKDPIAHFNLGEVLEKQGDAKGALAEYRTAAGLAPDNARFKARLEQSEHAADAPPAAATFKVEVRQVLVPVFVTDKEGHHVTGLTQADFKVYEDGVEQKLSGFSVENAGVPGRASAEAAAMKLGEAAAPGAAPPKHIPARRTYLICIDSMHGAFGNLVNVRTALKKLFDEEQAGDAQYIVVALGRTMEVIQNVTSDPEAVRAALTDKRFERLYQGSVKSAQQGDLAQFRRSLNEIRAACDAHDPACMQKASLPGEAESITAQERQNNMVFLSQLRSLVQQLSRGNDRRTFVLISDGFELVPGREAYELLGAYFPEFRSLGLRTVDRMPDLEPILRLAANHNIPIYTIDSRGLYGQEFFSASMPGGIGRLAPAVLNAMNHSAMEAGQTLSEIAATTGGTAFRNSNDILGGLQRAFADGRSYYMLAYLPSNSQADGKFRAITVHVRDGKLAVRAKKGYWAESDQKQTSP